MKSWLILCIGILIGIMLSAGGFVIHGIGRGFASLGALQYETDANVRRHLRDSGVALPAEAHDIHHAISGFVDHCEWIKFTVSKDRIWNVVGESLSKTEADFLSSFPRHFIKEIHQDPNPKYDLSWWNPASVRVIRSWSREEEKNGQHLYEDWLIDMESGTFYITRWDT